VTTHVAEYVVKRVSDRAFLADVQAKGKLLKDLLEEINSPHIVEVRGQGLMVGMELDIDTGPIVAEGYKQGLILVNAGPNVLRFVPPLVITEDEIKQVVGKVDAILQRM
jgi:acetylornithine/succinyldiaminopimelate/putrescine aminotransferase